VSQGHGEKTECSRIANSPRTQVIKASPPGGTGDGQLRSPHALAIDSQDHLYAADRSNSRVVVFDKDGKFLAAWEAVRSAQRHLCRSHDNALVIDSQSDDKAGDHYNPNASAACAVGSTKDGKVVRLYTAPDSAIRNGSPDRDCGGSERARSMKLGRFRKNVKK